MGKQIREDGPGSHLVKQGTPTMGGVLIVAVILGLALVFDALDASTYSPLFVLAVIGALGAIDDFLNARTGIGIRGRHKIIWQLIVAIVVAVYVQNHFGFNGVRVPVLSATTSSPRRSCSRWSTARSSWAPSCSSSWPWSPSSAAATG